MCLKEVFGPKRSQYNESCLSVKVTPGIVRTADSTVNRMIVRINASLLVKSLFLDAAVTLSPTGQFKSAKHASGVWGLGSGDWERGRSGVPSKPTAPNVLNSCNICV